MSETAMKNFLAQFSNSKENVTKWPHWMQESAKVATASFPKPHQSEANKDDQQKSTSHHS